MTVHAVLWRRPSPRKDTGEARKCWRLAGDLLQYVRRDRRYNYYITFTACRQRRALNK